MSWCYDSKCTCSRCSRHRRACDYRPGCTCSDCAAVRAVACGCCGTCRCSSGGSDGAAAARVAVAAAGLLLGEPTGVLGALLG